MSTYTAKPSPAALVRQLRRQLAERDLAPAITLASAERIERRVFFGTLCPLCWDDICHNGRAVRGCLCACQDEAAA